MTSEKEKVLEMVASGKVTAAQGDELIAALERPRRATWRALVSPFEWLPMGHALLVAAVVCGASLLLAWLVGVRFDGAIDMHVSGYSAPWLTPLLDQLVAWPLFALVLWGASRIVAREGRFIDFLAVVGVARAPLVLMAVVVVVAFPDPNDLLERAMTNPLDPVLLLVVVLAVPFIVWVFVWLYQGFKVASGARGAGLVIGFVTAVVVAEVVAKVALAVVPVSFTVAQPAQPVEPYVLEGTTPEERGEEFLSLLEAGRFSEAARTFNARMADGMGATELMVVWRATKLKTGPLERIEDRRVWEHEGTTIVDLMCQFESERLKVRVVFDPAQRVTGFWLKPPI